MKIHIQCEFEKDTASLYTEISSGRPIGIHRISVTSNTILLYMDDSNLSGQKIIVNQIKQFMRDNEVKYTMEML